MIVHVDIPNHETKTAKVYRALFRDKKRCIKFIAEMKLSNRYSHTNLKYGRYIVHYYKKPTH